jgi:hypothetical protein
LRISNTRSFHHRQYGECNINQAQKRAGAFPLIRFCLGDIMRASFPAVAASAVIVLVSTWAQTRTLHSDTLARYEAITSYCEQADPASAAQYGLKLADLTRGHSTQEIAADRSSSSYRNAMAQANATLSKASLTTGESGCSEFLAEK